MSKPSEVTEVIRAIAAGSPIDWETVRSTPAEASVVSVLNELNVIARIAEVHGTAEDPAPVDEIAEDRLQAWGPLTVIEREGAGSYGVVYRAWDSRLDREVALKLLRPRNAPADAEIPTVDEGRVLARVRHPNVVTIYGADRINGRVGLWMEFIEGRTLAAIVRDAGPFDAVQAARTGIEITRGLAAVHRAGLLHRDVKAQNIMRQDDGRTVLMDFGTVHAAGEAAAGSVAGTPLYVAPELLSGAPASPSTDLYSVGIVLYHLVTGSYPVVAADLAGVRAGHRAHQVRPLGVARRNLPRRFIEIVDRATNPDPNARFQHADDLERALAAFVAAADPESVRARRIRHLVATSIVLAALAAGGTVVVEWQHLSPAVTFHARDWVLVTAFENKTGDPVFDGTIEYAFERELSESRFVNVVPKERIDDTLRLMKKRRDIRVDRATGLEVCLRDGGIRAMLTGRIEKFGGTYIVSTLVVDPNESGRTMAAADARATDEAHILDAIHQLSARVREALGENPPGAHNPPVGLERVTTVSLQALQLYTQGIRAVDQHEWRVGAELLQRAVHEDPDFASARIYLAYCLKNIGRPPEEFLPHAGRAVDLADRATDRERYFILGSYHNMIGQNQKAASLYEALLQLYPDDFWGTDHLAATYRALGRTADASALNIRLATMRPNDFSTIAAAAMALEATSRTLEAPKALVTRARLLDKARAEPTDIAFVDFFSSFEAWIDSDAAGAIRLADALRDRSPQHEQLAGQVHLAFGQIAAAEEIFRHAAAEGDRHALLAFAALCRGDRARLASHAREAVNHPLQNQKPLLAWLLLQTRQMVEVQRVYAREMASTSASRAIMAEVRLANGYDENAIAELEQLREKRGGDFTGAGQYFRGSEAEADALVAHGDLQKAAAVLEDASEPRWKIGLSGGSFPGVFWLRVRAKLARVYRQMGRLDDANRIDAELAKLLALSDRDFKVDWSGWLRTAADVRP
jgi:serine/threonine-protein kinase